MSHTMTRLEAVLPEHLIVPGDSRYDTSRGVYFGAVDRRPTAIVQPGTADEVATVIRAVRDAGARLSVKGGGHGFTSAGVRDDTVVLDLSRLRGVSVDSSARLARAGGGATTGAYTAVAGEHGLATGFGDSAGVGLGGIALHGGIGFLHRRFGLTLDSMVGAQVVTADGVVVEASAEEHADLFWALRGGGGAFGVVTRLDLRLHPVGQVRGGMLMGPARPDAVSDLIELFHESVDPRGDLSGIVQVMRAPALAMIPPELHGKVVCAVFLVHAGPPAEGDRVLERVRAILPEAQGDLGPMPYGAMFEAEGGPRPPSRIRAASSFAAVPGADAIQGAFDRLAEPHSGMTRMVQFRPMGGAVAKVDPDATAFAHRTAPMLLLTGAIFGDAAEAEAERAWVHSTLDGLAPAHERRGPYLGFLADEGVDAVRAAFPESHWTRLRQVKGRYDPDNVFDGNHNVPPA